MAHPRHPLTGKQITVRASSAQKLAQCLAHLNDLRDALRLGMLDENEVAKLLRRLNHGSHTLEDASRAYIARPVLSDNTRRNVTGMLATHWRPLARLDLEALDPPRLARWVDDLRPRLTSSTIGLCWRLLRAVVRHAAERGWIVSAPWGLWRPNLRAGDAREPRPRREAARTGDELRALLEAADCLDAAGALGDGTAAKIAASAMLGLRRGELAGLSWRDVDASGQCVSIARQAGGARTKGRRVDVIRALPELFDRLERHRRELESLDLYTPQGPVFPCGWRSAPGAPRPYLPGAEVLTRAELREAVSLAGLPHPERWSPHSLRDTFVTLEADGAGGDLAAVAERSRHASIGSLVRYLRARTRLLAPPRMIVAAPAPKLTGGGT